MMSMVLPLAAKTMISHARIWPAPDHTRLVFDTSSHVSYKTFMLKKPRRLVVDIANTRLKADFRDLDFTGSPVRSIRTGLRNRRDLRVVLDLNKNISLNTFQLPPSGRYGHRLVIDMLDRDKSKKQRPVVKKTVTDHESKRDIIVYIDPGHGGEDPGAIGPGGVREKNVVLKISRELRALISSQPGYRAVLTRDGDYYVGLRNRTRLARKGNADILVSVHADAFKDARATGASVYALSGKGATSETARWLAAIENRADLIGGVGSVSLDDKDSVLAGVLLDLSMTASLKASLDVGRKVLGSVSEVGRLHRKHVEQAGFAVLKSPDIPSILVETGFISNPVEEKRLNSRKYQKQMAKAIRRGVVKHFTNTPPAGTLIAWKQEIAKRNVVVKYKIKRGDTLSAIALDNRTTVSKIREYNGLSTNSIRIGQVIQIPAS
ncbi:MAG: N-acetylmuramoyl-L-alanine amidase [Gammaproteobacteria bacterium]|nr:MAG: N-acetylmuramoyl-L-alanine amidase [Gammaproteobacteria bacterium]